MPAIICALQKWRSDLVEDPFFIYTDHKGLFWSLVLGVSLEVNSQPKLGADLRLSPGTFG